MSMFIADVLATMMLVWLGDGVVANVVLKKSKGYGSGWIVIATGWGLAVAMSGYVGGLFGGHNNPAVALAFAVTGIEPWSNFAVHLVGTMVGGFLGGLLVWLQYLPHWKITEEKDDKLAVFATAPAIRNTGANLLSEYLATVALILCLFGIAKGYGGTSESAQSMNLAMSNVVYGFMVWSIGLSLGGPTGYAINPARDLGPRLAHAFLPIFGKGGSDWSYSWIPVVGPFLGAASAAIAWNMILNVF
jgi:glycerol uptake facilitator protein